ncbi:MAG TPA: UDP-N-acetylglucosamine 2-epimerase [Bacteroidales bacterium]|jgi:GDP/UDP-N,N'-diacetylbacillosamine 2-epimerase (hydrolysing)|nr:UDP-N-acetylglucosamine 2-epimerase [Bacteroidales bacterium]HQB71030.1 UDP-N-acetylglucosamine 2-epimerase [Bacteroidales bacterium]
MRKICIVTGTRAEYGLLSPLIRAVHEDPEMELQLLVTGMHLSPEFGNTWTQIRDDGFPIAKKIEMLLSSDTAVGISKSNALALISFAEALNELQPDIMIVLGDRTETFAAVQAALIAGVPTGHISGGELTMGAYDDAIRHSITKMSQLHFTATEVYRRRVIQLGEQPASVFNVGAPGLDNIRRLPLLSREELEQALGCRLRRRNLLITFHPVTLEQQSAAGQFGELLAALDELDDCLLIFTKPNSDKDGRSIIALTDDYVARRPQTSIAFDSLGQLRYLSAVRQMDAVVGNSSSGIVEVPALQVPTVNIGDRQRGRLRAPSVFDCEPRRADISRALQQALAYDRRRPLQHPYGDGHACEKIFDILKHSPAPALKKAFYDLGPDFDPFTLRFGEATPDTDRGCSREASTDTNNKQ